MEPGPSRGHAGRVAARGRPGSRGLSGRGSASIRSPGFQARRLALLSLFEGEFRAGTSVDALDRLSGERRVSRTVHDHARTILEGVEGHREELDRRIVETAPAIPVAELGRVERSILRSALFEVLYSAATPSGDVIRDAVALARIYAGDAARRLVNGVLGTVSRSSGAGGSGD